MAPLWSPLAASGVAEHPALTGHMEILLSV
jgi:hypothetical protein